MDNTQSHSVRNILQELVCGDLRQRRLSPADTMFANTGRKLYVIGDIDGDFRPRSNPYDLYAFGAPHPKDPLANALQGVWAQPVKALNGYTFIIEVNGKRWQLCDADRFTQTFAYAQFDYQRGNLKTVRRDFAAQDHPVLFTGVTVQNIGSVSVEIQLSFVAAFDLKDAWFTSFAKERNQGENLTVENKRLVARANVAPDAWSVVIGSDLIPDATRVEQSSEGPATGEFQYTVRLAAGAEQSWYFGIVVETEAGATAALQNLDEWLPQRENLLVNKQVLYENRLMKGPRFHCPDSKFNIAFDLACANMQFLEAEAPKLGRYFYAGIENFPFWFGIDSAYSVSGLMTAGLVRTIRNAILIGAQFQQEGRVPHQISPSGKIAFPGHASVTPLWVLGLWDAYRWTGDREMLAAAYPAAVKGLFDYTLGKIDSDGDGYPSGPGIVEREDMGAEKLDSTSYLWAGLNALTHLAEAINDPDNANRACRKADDIASRFQKDWWDASNGTYTMSLDETSHELRPVPHWAVVIPLEVGLAEPDHAQTTLATLRQEYLNEWGLKHTRGDDERVWTLPTATLSRAAYRYAETALGFEMLAHLAQTLEHGSIGMFHELIPDGMCFVQLWSATSFVRGIVEDLMGIDVRADQHALTLAPNLPEDWDFAELENLTFGEHTITVRITRKDITLTHLHGPVSLQATIRSPRREPVMLTLAPGSTAGTLTE
jgi:glycogen debranching enzyme